MNIEDFLKTTSQNVSLAEWTKFHLGVWGTGFGVERGAR